MHTAVLVEGVSDQAAVQALATRLDRDLAAERTVVVPMGGARGVRRHVRELGPAGLGLCLTGLCDSREERDFTRALEREGLGAHLDRASLAAMGFFVCDLDLEDELIRALGADAVESVIDAAGELRSLRIMQQMPAQRDWTVERQLRRFIGSRSGRKRRYASLLVDALDLSRVPEPLDALLTYLGITSAGATTRRYPRARGREEPTDT